MTVDIGERGEKKPVVKGPERQARVKEQLLKKFAEEAFSANAFEADEVLNDFLTRDVLEWGDQLITADAAATAAVAKATAHCSLGEHGKARDVLVQALPILEQVHGHNHANVPFTLGDSRKVVADLLNALGAAYCHVGDYAKALDILERALPIYEHEYGRGSKEVAVVLNTLGTAHRRLEENAKAKDCFKHSLAIEEKVYGRESTEVVSTLTNLANAYGKLGKRTKQRGILDRVLLIQNCKKLEERRDMLERELKRKGMVYGLGNVLKDLASAYGQLDNQAKLQDVMKRLSAIKGIGGGSGSDSDSGSDSSSSSSSSSEERGGSAVGTQGLAIADQSYLFLGTSVGSFSFGNLSVEDNWNDQSHRCWKSRSRDRPSHIGKRRSDPSSMDRFCMDRDLANLDPFVGGAVKWAVPIDVPGKRRDPAYLHELLVSESL